MESIKSLTLYLNAFMMKYEACKSPLSIDARSQGVHAKCRRKEGDEVETLRKAVLEAGCMNEP